MMSLSQQTFVPVSQKLFPPLPVQRSVAGGREALTMMAMAPGGFVNVPLMPESEKFARLPLNAPL